ncbi:MAG TPA: hypothetical protein VH277_06185 [Gemmatimonadaceae bacterium]|jgi:hypothetical protein|nr:hypothetical protein [Gemmatimonadaceae bacterium]
MTHIWQSGRALCAALVVASGLAACSDFKDNLLEAPDPDIIDPTSVQSAAGATALRTGALAGLRLATVGNGNAGTEGTWLLGGLLGDEWTTTSTFVQNDEVDERQVSLSNSSVDGSLRAIYRVPRAVDQAVALLNKYKPLPASDIGEMYFAKGFAFAQLASDFCNGIPLSDSPGTEIKLGLPLTVTDVFKAANAAYDSALALANGTDTASVTITRASKIGEARALLGISLANAPQAAALVSGIPTAFTYNVTSSTASGANNNGIWNQGSSQRRYGVGDSLQGNARNILVKNNLPFFSVKDPRVPSTYSVSSKGDTTKAQDGLSFSITTTLWGQTSAMSVVNGVDARLIEAEAFLQAGDVTNMIKTLNTLRATTIILSDKVTYTANALPALVDPGTPDARINLLFREKAFWTFGRGERLNDLRRLIRQYGRTADQVFPIGQHYRGTTFSTDVNLPITTGELNGNPNFKGCTDRNA